MPKQQVSLWDSLTLTSAVTPIAGAIGAARGRSHAVLLVSLAIGFCVGIASFMGIRATLGRLGSFLARNQYFATTRNLERALTLLYFSAILWIVAADFAGYYAANLFIHPR